MRWCNREEEKESIVYEKKRKIGQLVDRHDPAGKTTVGTEHSVTFKCATTTVE